MTFTPNIDPLGNLTLSALVAFIPILCFFLSLVVFKMKGYNAGLLTVLASLCISIFVYQMPSQAAFASFILGFTYGIWPIAWIIVAAIFLYKLSIKSGQFEIIKKSIMAITPDHRIQVILIGFCFGAFLEGAIGFGGPVAISAALLMGLGIKPLQAAGLCLIANTAPVAFGAVGIPIIALAGSLGLSSLEISAMVGRILPIASLLVPFFIVFLMDGSRGVKETWPAVLVAAGVFAAAQFLSSNFLGPELPDIISALASLLATGVFLLYWRPKHIYRADGSEYQEGSEAKLGAAAIFYAWLPFIFLIICIVIWTSDAFKSLFAKDALLSFSVLKISFASLGDLSILKPLLIEGKDPGKQALALNLPLINTTGTAILTAAILSIFAFRIKAKDAAQCFSATINEMALPIFTIGLVVSFAYMTNYSGASTTLGSALAQTGGAFTFFSPIIGWLGVFLTGSDTSSNLLFGALQQASALKLGVPDTLYLAANTCGGVVGKMISPQSIAVACAAVGMVGRESELFRFTLKYSLLFIIFISLIIVVIEHLAPGIIPASVAISK